jgi:hypothetical protein
MDGWFFFVCVFVKEKKIVNGVGTFSYNEIGGGKGHAVEYPIGHPVYYG